jgi:hypothetical protein
MPTDPQKEYGFVRNTGNLDLFILFRKIKIENNSVEKE